MLLVLGGGTGAAVAAEREMHAFDPVLSLTGNCETEPVDPIPDPGCPGGEHPPKGRFKAPAGVATDSYGDIYVASAGSEESNGDGHIDVFDPQGHFITELLDPNSPGSMAVDSEGNLYVANRSLESNENVVRYTPTLPYEPEAGVIEYGTPPSVLVPNGESSIIGIALERSTDRLWVKFGDRAELFSSKAEGNAPIENFGSFGGNGVGIAVDDTNDILYASNLSVESGVFIEAFKLTYPHDHLFTIKGSTVPNGKFQGFVSLAVDEETGHLLVFDGAARKVYEFDNTGTYLATIDVNVGKAFENVFKSMISVDNGEHSPNGAENQLGGSYLYVPSGLLHTHMFAFGPSKEGPPEVKSVTFANVGEVEAELDALVQPFGLPTHYVFETLPLQQFEEQGESFAGATVAGKGDIPAGLSPVAVSAETTGLQPGVAYRFRVVVTNNEGSDEAADTFATYLAAEAFSPCQNDALRTGLSALLPDCRAYELVTPPESNARPPHGVNGFLGSTFFATRETSPSGEKVSFEIEGGTIPGSEATGGLAGDPYLASRGEGGWTTANAGPTGTEVPKLLPGSNSPDQGYSFWSIASGSGGNFVRYPDGHSAPVGRGSFGTDPTARGKLISEDGSHIIFQGKVQLEPDAAPDGTEALYDRTPDELTHVISLLPGDEALAAGKNASYEGASLDGKGVAFKVGAKLYLRYENTETFEVGENVTFAGVAEDGARVFYLEGGNLFRFDAATEAVTPFATSGDVIPVNVSADGSTAYYVSPTVISGLENPNESEPVLGGENIYRSKEGEISFVGTVTKRDVEGEFINELTGGLGLWTKVVGSGRLANDPSRTTPDGDALLFESRAQLDGYDPEGHPEVYRYDSFHDELDCLSCNPTLAAASGTGSLQSVSHQLGGLEALGPYSDLANLNPDGGRAFFQSTEALVPNDSDSLQDVYEWEAQGLGSCQQAGGCLYLISSGRSARTDYLYAVSETGDDVFFRSGDLLLPSDLEDTSSIYDARINGGFSEPAAAQCEGEGCRPALLPAPPMLGPESGANSSADSRKCPKGKRKVHHKGKVRCVKKHRHHHRKAGSKKRGGAK